MASAAPCSSRRPKPAFAPFHKSGPNGHQEGCRGARKGTVCGCKQAPAGLRVQGMGLVQQQHPGRFPAGGNQVIAQLAGGVVSGFFHSIDNTPVRPTDTSSGKRSGVTIIEVNQPRIKVACRGGIDCYSTRLVAFRLKPVQQNRFAGATGAVHDDGLSLVKVYRSVQHLGRALCSVSRPARYGGSSPYPGVKGLCLRMKTSFGALSMIAVQQKQAIMPYLPAGGVRGACPDAAGSDATAVRCFPGIGFVSCPVHRLI